MLKISLAIATVAVALVATPACAQERIGDAAMGALAGVVVLGPIGAIAGGVVGYTQGPHIARRIGMKDHSGSRPPAAQVARQ